MLLRVIFKLLVATLAAMSLRFLFTLSDASIVCSTASTRDKVVTLVFDALTIITIGAAIGITYARSEARHVWLAWVLPIVGCAFYIVFRNPCLIGM